MIANSLSMLAVYAARRGDVNAQVLEESLHADAEIFIVPVDNRPAGGLASPALRAVDA
jgi:hypothetical protein